MLPTEPMTHTAAPAGGIPSTYADVGPDQGFRSQLLHFLGGALLALVGLFVVFRLPVVHVYALQPWAEFLAQMAATSLQWLGRGVSVNGEVLSAGGHRLRVSEECSGLKVIGVISAHPRIWGGCAPLLGTGMDHRDSVSAHLDI